MEAYNPYLPINEYIPDGEPHVFDDRIYIYGSHDVAGGTTYCQGHYAVWSAPVENIKNWTCEGTSYYRTQDPSNQDDSRQLWAPDVTQGPDGRYYLYYCLSLLPEIGVAVSDRPAGPFSFYGHVKYPKSIEGGRDLHEFMPFDPAVLTDDDGRVYLYYGFEPGGENSVAVELEPDMLTVKDVPHVLIPGKKHTAGTGFEGHGFFEASSIRKIHGRYYFIYSSEKSHELCYAISDHPVEGFTFGGTIVSNGDIGLNGRIQPVFPLGNNHGSIERIDGAYYIFYHRQTNGTEYSRQGCAEKIEILEDGSIRQVEITSCGLNGGPLPASGSYPAVICCHLSEPDSPSTINYHDGASKQHVRITQERYEPYITDVKDGAIVGWKYFDFIRADVLAIESRGDFVGTVTVSHDEACALPIGELRISTEDEHWHNLFASITPHAGKRALYLHFHGTGRLDLKRIVFL